jgi:arabinogalactan endo-1,4-beta-galactosidase
MNKMVLILFVLFFTSCIKDNRNGIIEPDQNLTFISAVDISNLPEISMTNPNFYDANGVKKDFLTVMKESGVNTIRLRLWVNPSTRHSGLDEVKQFSETLKAKGFKIWLTVHYSDTWADPGHQITPQNWQGLNFNALIDSVESYTRKIATEIQPEFIQIGNEINTGFLHPNGDIINNYSNFIALMNRAISTVRLHAPDTKIMLHYAGFDGSDWFFDKVKNLDYDLIGLSYYPIWHGKSIDSLKSKMNLLSRTYNKKIVIAETAYPFTLGWNDWTNNIVGLNEQLIMPDFPATVLGQKNFIKKIRTVTQEIELGYGFCYWGAELIAWKGNQSTQGSPWENQALFDFQNRALPVLSEFKAP